MVSPNGAGTADACVLRKHTAALSLYQLQVLPCDLECQRNKDEGDEERERLLTPEEGVKEGLNKCRAQTEMFTNWN